MRFYIRVRWQQPICCVAIFIGIEKTPSKHGISTELDDDCFAIVWCKAEEHGNTGRRSACTGNKAITFGCDPFRYAFTWKIKPTVIVTCCMVGLRIHTRTLYWVSVHVNYTSGKAIFLGGRLGNGCRGREGFFS